MKVSELIEKLQKANPDTPVRILTYMHGIQHEDDAGQVFYVNKYVDGNFNEGVETKIVIASEGFR